MTADLQHLSRTFVALADTLVDEYDVIDLLHVLAQRSVDLLDVDAAGVMIADRRGRLRVAAASTERTRLLELFELQADEGPCLDCYRTGQPISWRDLSDGGSPWPRFAKRALAEEFSSAHARPMRLRNQVIGSLNLFRREPRDLHDDDVGIAQALADVATIAILQERLIEDSGVLATQLQTALDSRVVIEQAKGVLAERQGVDMETAFTMLRESARRNQRRLSDLAREVVAGRGRTDLPG